MRVQGSSNQTQTHYVQTVANHIIEEIVSHTIWDKVGSICGIGHFAVSLLGNLLTFQNLEGGDQFLIPRSIPRPTATWDINPRTNRCENCIILENGKKLFGQEIINFYQGLKFIRFV